MAFLKKLDSTFQLRVLALDVGLKRVGVAITNCQRTLIKPVGVIRMQKFKGKTLFVQLKKLLADFWSEIGIVVLGKPYYPKSCDLNPIDQYVIQCARFLKCWTSWEVVFQSESYSTQWALETLRYLNYSRAYIEQQNDAWAAVKILNDYFCARNLNLLLTF